MIANDIYENFRDVPKDNPIAIWGINYESYILFLQTINVRLRVQFFVDADEIYEGLPIFDKKIIKKDELLCEKNIFVLCSSIEYERYREWIEEHLQGRFYVVELGKINETIRNSSSTYIYGAGNAGRKTLQILRRHGVEVDAFVDSDNEKIGKSFHCIPIIGKDNLDKNDVVVVSTIYYDEICQALAGVVETDNVFVDYRNSRPGPRCLSFDNMNMLWLEKDGKRYPEQIWNSIAVFNTEFFGKEIFVCGVGKVAKQLKDILTLLGIQNKCIAEPEMIYDLAYENMENKLIIATEDGFIGKLQETGLIPYVHYRYYGNLFYGQRNTIKDDLLDYSYQDNSDKYPGFAVFGDEESATMRIVTLGGSTTDAGTYENMIKSWPEYLSEQWKNVVVFNGGTQGYNSARECMKLLRDVTQLKPDIIISYSGVNEWADRKAGKEGYPFAPVTTADMGNTCMGVKSQESKAAFWIRMQRSMKGIADMNGSKFISILQPYLTIKRDEAVTPYEQRFRQFYFNNQMHLHSYKMFVKEVKESISQYNWMYDLTEVFDNEKETVYRDICHLNDLGNQIIAENVCDIINDYCSKTENIK